MVAAALVAVGIGGLSNAALGADMPLKAAPSQSYDWSGCYIGAHGGGAWSQIDWTPVSTLSIGNYRANGWIAGGQIGCDYQTGGLVFGIEGQFSAAKLDGKTTPDDGMSVTSSRIDKLATGTGRVGYAFDHVLPYVKGGFAWVHDESHEIVSATTGNGLSAGGSGVFGWTIGGGVEVAFRPNWSWKVEYNHIDLGTNGFSFTASGLSGSVPLENKQTVNDILIGLNYRFQ
jgi:outer membrane immunogenic protein